MSGYLTGVLVAYFINVMIAYSVFTPAAAGILNLGAAGFVAVGAYLSAWLASKFLLQPVFTIPLAVAATFLLGIAVSLPIIRTRGVYMVLANIAFGEIVSGVVINIDAVGGAAGYPVRFFVGLPVITACCAAIVALTIYLFGTRFGLALRSIHDDEPVAALFGVDVRRAKVFAFAIGAGIAGLGGALYAHHYTYIDIAYFNTAMSIYVLLYVLIGGTQTPFGPFIGAAFFSLLPEVLRGAEHWRYVIFAIIIILVMAMRPEGILTRSNLRMLSRDKAGKALS